jgi:hypothetical protein
MYYSNNKSSNSSINITTEVPAYSIISIGSITNYLVLLEL